MVDLRCVSQRVVGARSATIADIDVTHDASGEAAGAVATGYLGVSGIPPFDVWYTRHQVPAATLNRSVHRETSRPPGAGGLRAAAPRRSTLSRLNQEADCEAAAAAMVLAEPAGGRGDRRCPAATVTGEPLWARCAMLARGAVLWQRLMETADPTASGRGEAIASGCGSLRTVPRRSLPSAALGELS